MSAVTRRPRLGLEQIQYLLLVTGESAWINGWALAMGGWFGAKGEGPALDFPSIVAVLTAALVGARLAATVGRQSLPARWALSLLGMVTAYLIAAAALPALKDLNNLPQAVDQLFNSDAGTRAVRAIIVVVLCWWRGINIGRARPSEATVEESFRIGLVAMVSLLIMVALAGNAIPLATTPLILSTLVLVCAGLMGTPLASISEVREQQRRRDPSAVAPVGPWLGMVVMVVGGLLVVVLMTSQLLSFDRVIAVYDAVRGPVGDALWVVIYLLALPVGLLVQLLVFLMSLLPRSNKPPTPPEDPLKALGQMQQGKPPQLSPEVILAVQITLIVVAGALLLWLFTRALRRMQLFWGQDGEDDIRDFVWTRPDLGALLRGLLARFRPRRAFLPSALSGRPNGAGAGRSVRELYRDFLRLGITLGRPRRPSETALEYERRLGEDGALPGVEEMRLITDGYVKVRYAPPSETAPNPEPVASALARLRGLWQPLGRGKK